MALPINVQAITWESREHEEQWKNGFVPAKALPVHFAPAEAA